MQKRPSALTRVRIDLAYDGTEFSGWAKQPGLRTVQATVEEALAILLRVEQADVALTVAGRTDAGVHALHQITHLDIPDTSLPKLWGRGSGFEGAARKLNGVLNRLHAPDIRCNRIQEVSASFDARFSALARTYEYRVRPPGAPQDPRMRDFTAEVKRPVDVGLLEEASQSLLGLRDFAAYCKAREGATSIRELLEFTWKQDESGVLVARIRADAFCHSMVRSLVGAVLAVSTGAVSMNEFQHITATGQRSSKVRVMPPGGLTLMRVEYPEDAFLEQRARQTRARRQ